MPLTTNLSVSPYFDDFDAGKNYYKILFKPSTAVQVREMNQLQTLLQNQIEEFGDNILKTGTILSGCQFQFKSSMPYIKVLDRSSTGGSVDVRSYKELFAQGETTGLSAKITHTIQGFQGDGVNLNTLYLDYQDNGFNDLYSEFNQGETVRIFSQQNILYDIIVEPGGASQGFSNADLVYIVSAIRVANVTSSDVTGIDTSYNVGDILVDDIVTPTIRVEIYDTPTLEEETNTLIVPIKPIDSDLVPAPDSSKWTNIKVGTVLLNSSNASSEAEVAEIIGSGATGSIVTTRSGSIAETEITRGGSGYRVLPYVTIGSTTASTSQLAALNLTAQDYLTKLTVASEIDGYDQPVGVGYGIQVSKGKIYQKGYFLNVDTQFAMVDKYGNTPSDLAVGFTTVESVVNVFTDSTLYDNAEDFTNFSAPGANRLKLEPKLSTKSIAEQEADPEFFPLVKFSEGRPYAQFKTTQYNKIGDMLARRTYEESGNYSLDKFKLTIRSTNDIANTDTHFVYVMDPGHAYINGYRVKTDGNYAKKVEKAKIASSLAEQSSDLVYGNYITVNQLAGVHVFKSGQTIDLYGAQNATVYPNEGIKYYDNYATSTIVDATRFTGSKIGEAKIRSVVLESGKHGTAEAIYRVYLFDINMDRSSFRDVRSIYVPSNGGSEDGIADVVLSQGSQQLKIITANGEELADSNLQYERFCELKQPQLTSLLVPTGKATTVDGQAFANTTGVGESINYSYRTSSLNQAINSSGQITITGLPANNLFDYDGTLTDFEENSLIIVPEAELLASAFVTGVTLTEASNTATTQTLDATVAAPNFSTNLRTGDFIKSSSGQVVQVLEVNGQNRITIRKDATTFEGASLTLQRAFPKDVPISLAERTNANAVVNNDKTQLTINLGTNIDTTVTTLSVTYNVLAKNVSSTQINARRNRFVKLTTTGDFPKSLGLPGVFRLRKVYNGADTTAADITREFFVDDGQRDGYWGLSKLERAKGATTTLAGTILVEVDYLEPVDPKGVKSVDSFTINDEVPLSSLTTDVNTLEIPYYISNFARQELQLRECLDFRPFCDSTAADAVTPAAATVDPSSVEAFTNVTGYAFPVPQGDVKYDITYYNSRIDVISLTNEGEFEFNLGTRDVSIKTNPNRLQLYKVDVPPYPSLPISPSAEIVEIMATGTISKRASTQRFSRYTCKITELEDQTQGYTMAQIAQLERRISALEYNQNLSLLENETSNRAIPSSIDPTLEKFKFGFYVDNFENFNLTNVLSPEFSASIYEYNLFPNRISQSLQLKPCNPDLQVGNKIVFPYNRFRLLSQKNATYGPFIEEPPLPEIQTICQFVQNKNDRFNNKNTAQYSQLQGVWEEWTFVGANYADETTRNIDIKFYAPSTGIGIEILQTNTAPKSGSVLETGDVIWTSSVQAAEALPKTDAFKVYQKFYSVRDAAGREIDPNTNPWFTSLSSANRILTNIPGQPDATYKAYRGAGQISIPYDHTKGRYITVRVFKWAPVYNIEVCYPAIKLTDPVYDGGSTTIDTTPPCPPKGKFMYAKCEGSDYVTYVQDGNCRKVVGSRQVNSSRCVVAPPPEPPPPPGNPCPAAGTFKSDKCVGSQLYVYEYNGKRDKNGKCAIRLASSTTDERCAPPPLPPEPTGECDQTPVPANVGDDGCDIVTDPECAVEVKPVNQPSSPPAPPPVQISIPNTPPPLPTLPPRQPAPPAPPVIPKEPIVSGGQYQDLRDFEEPDLWVSPGTGVITAPPPPPAVATTISPPEPATVNIVGGTNLGINLDQYSFNILF